jgi:hypothetical protein
MDHGKDGKDGKVGKVEQDSQGPVPREPPPTGDMPEEVKQPSPDAEELQEGESETEGEIQEPPD